MNAPVPGTGRAAPSVGATTVVETRDLGHWTELVSAAYGGLEVVTSSEQPFTAALIRRSLDRLQTIELRVSPQSPQCYRRTEAMVKRHPSDYVFVTMMIHGQALIVQDGRSCTLGPGDLAFIEGRRPHSVVVEESSRLVDFVWPRDAIGLSDRERRAVTARPLRATSPMGRWLSPALTGLHGMDDGISPAGAVRIADGISKLLVTAALELTSPNDPTARWRRQYEAMVNYIERNIGNSDLSVDSVAENFFMSTRSVHRLFARFDTTVASAIRATRLEAARRMMLSQCHTTKPFSVIAGQLGFSSLQVFSRAFTARYGIGPTQYRNSLEGRTVGAQS